MVVRTSGHAAPRSVHRRRRSSVGTAVLRPPRSRGVAVCKRYSTTNPGEVSGYAVGLPRHTGKDGQIIWYGGGKLTADLTLPKLRRRWTGPGVSGQGLPAAAARAVLRNQVAAAADQVCDERQFLAVLRDAGVLVRLRFSETCPGQVTGYSVGLPDTTTVTAPACGAAAAGWQLA
jgi:hypothetical protein